MKLMNTTIAAGFAAALGFVAAPAFAGGLAEPIMTPAPTPMAAPAPVMMGSDWTGFYAGGQLGYARVNGDTATGAELFAEEEDLTYGAHAGYLYDLGNFVLGGEAQIDGTEVSVLGDAIDVDYVARLGAIAGYDAGNFLPYLTVGVAQLATSTDEPLLAAFDTDDTGYYYGLGLTYQATDSFRVGAEVLQHEFEDYNDTGADIDALTGALKVSFAF